jgi:hypothetical protein
MAMRARKSNAAPQAAQPTRLSLKSPLRQVTSARAFGGYTFLRHDFHVPAPAGRVRGVKLPSAEEVCNSLERVMSAVSITRLRVGSWHFLPAFLFHSIRTAWQARNAAGIRSATLLKDDWRTYWTRTVWTDEAAMKTFMACGSHRRAMPKMAQFCDEASVARWNQVDETPPIWSEVHRRMCSEGRRSRVKHPSAAQEAFQIPAPRLRPFSQIQLK